MKYATTKFLPFHIECPSIRALTISRLYSTSNTVTADRSVSQTHSFCPFLLERHFHHSSFLAGGDDDDEGKICANCRGRRQSSNSTKNLSSPIQSPQRTKRRMTGHGQSGIGWACLGMEVAISSRPQLLVRLDSYF